MSNEAIQIRPPAEFSDSEKGALTPFSKQFVTLSKQGHIQLKWDANRWRALTQQWKDKYIQLEQSQHDHENRAYLKLLEKHRQQTEKLERTQVRVLQLEKQLFGRKTEKKPEKKRVFGTCVGCAEEKARRTARRQGSWTHASREIAA